MMIVSCPPLARPASLGLRPSMQGVCRRGTFQFRRELPTVSEQSGWVLASKPSDMETDRDFVSVGGVTEFVAEFGHAIDVLL